MTVSPIADSACRNCGEELAPGARFCQSCGVATGNLPAVEPVPGPVVRGSVERRWLGLPARFIVLCLGFAAFGAAIGLFATGSWGWGVLLLLPAIVLPAALVEAGRRNSDVWVRHSTRLAADGRSQAALAAEVWKTRVDSAVSRWRTRSRLDAIAVERGPTLRALGESVWEKDRIAEQQARQRLAELERERRLVEEKLAERLAGADERIRRARLPVQETLMVTPNEPNPPYPPPDEGNPPQPAEVPEAYPPPDEGTPPVPAPDPGQTESE